MRILYEIDHGAIKDGKTVIKVRGWFVNQYGKRVEHTEYAGRYAYEDWIKGAKTRVEKYLTTERNYHASSDYSAEQQPDEHSAFV